MLLNYWVSTAHSMVVLVSRIFANFSFCLLGRIVNFLITVTTLTKVIFWTKNGTETIKFSLLTTLTTNKFFSWCSEIGEKCRTSITKKTCQKFQKFWETSTTYLFYKIYHIHVCMCKATCRSVREISGFLPKNTVFCTDKYNGKKRLTSK